MHEQSSELQQIIVSYHLCTNVADVWVALVCDASVPIRLTFLKRLRKRANDAIVCSKSCGKGFDRTLAQDLLSEAGGQHATRTAGLACTSCGSLLVDVMMYRLWIFIVILAAPCARLCAPVETSPSSAAAQHLPPGMKQKQSPTCATEKVEVEGKLQGIVRVCRSQEYKGWQHICLYSWCLEAVKIRDA